MVTQTTNAFFASQAMNEEKQVVITYGEIYGGAQCHCVSVCVFSSVSSVGYVIFSTS